MREQTIWKMIMLAVHRVSGVRLFRNNTATGWAGKSRRLRPGEVVRAMGGEVLIADPQPLRAGLQKGSADGIGWRTVTITDAMVGQNVAVFLSIEAKTPTGRVSPDQKIWLDAVRAAGGIAIVARSPEDAVAQISSDER